MKRIVTVFIACLSYFGAVPVALAANPAYDAADEFSQAGNPNGVWTYGSLPSAMTPFTIFTEHLTISGLNSWRRNEGGTGTPGFYANPLATTYSDSQQSLLSGELSCAPGQTSQCAIRFTAPAAGKYDVAGSFEGLTFASIVKGLGPGTTTDVSILLDGSSLAVLPVRGTRAASTKTFHDVLTLAAGAHLDFAVSGSSDGFASDLTRMEIHIEALPVPEPASAALMLAGMMTIGAILRGRRQT